METQSQDKDVMANIALVVGVLVILAVVIFLVARLMSVIDKNSIKGGEQYAEEKQALVAERLAKVGSVKTASSSPAAAGPKAARSAKDIVNGVCASCHGTGVLGAPKLKEAGDWAPRMAQGLPSMVNNAVNGLNSMPPKGGDATLSEAEIRSAVILMLKDAGQDVADDAAPAAETSKAEAAPVEASETVVAETTATEAEAVEAASPTDVVTDVASEVAETGSKLVSSTGETVATAAGAAVAAATTAAVAADEAVQKATADAPPANAAGDFAQGKKMYKQACFSCHDHGVAGAPKLGDTAAWAPRIANGKDALYASTINGKGAMPPKGGRIDASDEVIRETVDYMVSLSGG